MVNADSQEGSPYAAMQSAYKVAAELKSKGITNINIMVRAPGGHGAKTHRGLLRHSSFDIRFFRLRSKPR